MATMFVTCGNIGVGKTTFAKAFAKFNNYRYLGIDEAYAAINGDEKIHKNKFEVWQFFFQQIHMAIKLGQDVIVDTNAPFKSDREEFLNWFSEFDSHVLFWIDAPLEEAWRHNISRDRVVPRETFDYLAKNFEPPQYKEHSARSNWDYILKIENSRGVIEVISGIDFRNTKWGRTL